MKQALASWLAVFSLAGIFGFSGNPAQPPKIDQGQYLDQHKLRPPVHIVPHAAAGPAGLSPTQIKAAYKLPASGGSGTIAIIDAYDAPTAEADLGIFNTKFGLSACTTVNGCFEKHKMSIFTPVDSGWALESSLDTQWAHAIAPGAKVLLVEARSSSISDLLRAVDYARGRSDVKAVSMSWGGGEFFFEQSYDNHFTSPFGATFFAASGDSGSGVEWPAVSPNVIGVGGTSLKLASDGSVTSETAWSGSGGGRSAIEGEPSYQLAYGVANTAGRRAVPDVSFNADPASGYSVYDSTPYAGQGGWWTVGGTSAGAPQWAAIKTLGNSVTSAKLYTDAAGANYPTLFRDITSGTNGACGLICTAGQKYDFVTGLGSPLSINF